MSVTSAQDSGATIETQRTCLAQGDNGRAKASPRHGREMLIYHVYGEVTGKSKELATDLAAEWGGKHAKRLRGTEPRS